MSSLQMYDKLGGYTVLERLGKGGRCVVYHAHHEEHGDVAIKLMPTPVKGARGRLLHEARVAAALDHPNIIKVFGIGEHDRHPYIVMEMLQGFTLKAMMRAGCDLGLERRIALIKQVMHAIAYAHEHGVAHRDIKPQNIFITRASSAHVLDFGLALASDTGTDSSGSLRGTPAYMAPEQARCEEVDHRVDIFATGVVFYELVSGRRAFGGGSVNAVLARVTDEEPEPLHEVDERLPPELSTLVQTAMAKDPDERFQTMGEMLAALEQFEATLAERRAEVCTQISGLLALLGPIPPDDPGPPDLQIPFELPADYFELLALRERLEGQRALFEDIADELAWAAEMLDAPLAELDDEALRGIANRADAIGEVWPHHPRAGELGQRALQELRERLKLRQPVDWGNAGNRPS